MKCVTKLRASVKLQEARKLFSEVIMGPSPRKLEFLGEDATDVFP